jgi:hypothetical protein
MKSWGLMKMKADVPMSFRRHLRTVHHQSFARLSPAGCELGCGCPLDIQRRLQQLCQSKIPVAILADYCLRGMSLLECQWSSEECRLASWEVDKKNHYMAAEGHRRPARLPSLLLRLDDLRPAVGHRAAKPCRDYAR